MDSLRSGSRNPSQILDVFLHQEISRKGIFQGKRFAHRISCLLLLLSANCRWQLFPTALGNVIQTVPLNIPSILMAGPHLLEPGRHQEGFWNITEHPFLGSKKHWFILADRPQHQRLRSPSYQSYVWYGTKCFSVLYMLCSCL